MARFVHEMQSNRVQTASLSAPALFHLPPRVGSLRSYRVKIKGLSLCCAALLMLTACKGKEEAAPVAAPVAAEVPAAPAEAAPAPAAEAAPAEAAPAAAEAAPEEKKEGEAAPQQ